MSANTPPIAPTDPRLTSVQTLTAKQLAAALRISTRTVWRRVARTDAGLDDFPLPIRLAPRTLRWRLADVESYLKRLAQGRAATC